MIFVKSVPTREKKSLQISGVSITNAGTAWTVRTESLVPANSNIDFAALTPWWKSLPGGAPGIANGELTEVQLRC